MLGVSGYCPICDRLVQLVRAGRRWKPAPHPAEGDDTGGRVCPGSERQV